MGARQPGSEPLYRLGDVIEVVRRGVIVEVDPDDPARFGIASPDRPSGADAYFRTDDDRVRHTLVTAFEWPPLPGDTWTDATGKDWFAHSTEDGGHGIALTSEFGACFEDEDGLKTADQMYGPFRLKTSGKRRREQPKQRRERPC
ncbi:hypothetical protein [Nonomuraea sp. 10N515B]|uniref:hypothetical protein n=1 Tax=Nonomuraea sp. 10N515B TaxID=3457422 RepID=UPI003FCD30E1